MPRSPNALWSNADEGIVDFSNPPTYLQPESRDSFLPGWPASSPKDPGLWLLRHSRHQGNPDKGWNREKRSSLNLADSAFLFLSHVDCLRFLLVIMLSFNAAAWSWVVTLSLVSAQSSTQSHTTSSTSSSASATHTVKVGPRENPHQYVPHNVSANVGDVILFEFYPTNHSVVKADYMARCIPAEGEIFYSGQFNDFHQENGQIVGEVSAWLGLSHSI